MNNLDDLLVGPIGVILGILLIIWSVLMFFAPFFWYGTSKRAKEISEKLDTLIAIRKESNDSI